MLKGISPLVSPELLKILSEMGHGDEVVIGDGNFTAQSISTESKSKVLIRCDGNTIPEILKAIMPLFPLDKHVSEPVSLMEIGAQDKGTFIPKRWDEYKAIISEYEPSVTSFEMIERFAFYERAKKAYAIITSGDPEIYANIILKKGVIFRDST